MNGHNQNQNYYAQNGNEYSYTPPPPPNQGGGYYPPPPQGQYYQNQQQMYQQPYPPNDQYQTLPDQPNLYKPAYPPAPAPAPISGDHSHATVKYTKTSKFRDLWAALLYLAILGFFIAISIIYISNSKASFKSSTNKVFSSSFVTSLFISLGSSLAFSILYLIMCQKFAYFIIVASFWFSVFMLIATAIYYLAIKIYVMGAILLVFGILYALSWVGWKRAIPFTKIILETVTQIVRKFPSTIALSLFFSAIMIAFNVFCIYSLVASADYLKKYQKCTNTTDRNGVVKQTCSNTTLVLNYVFTVFVYFWSIQVILNTLHTAICGLFATYYFYDGTPEGYPTKNPLMSSLVRASFFSFGSICFGSLIVAVIQTIRALLQLARQQNSDDLFCSIIICCVDCILGCIEGMVEYFNKYAYIQIAIYGKPYIQASKDAWHLLSDRGVNAIVNDCLVNNVVYLGSFIAGIISALISYLVIRSFSSTLASSTLIVYSVASFVFGASIFTTINGVILSGSSTFFVCLAEDPYSIARTKPELFSEIVSKYPQVVEGVH
ncbi:Protein PNS1 [Smittium culicis]|uniref:Protein PNS1 n=1 Tax=Smittium culicis TaxID=133412 RepID=A0A1R1XJV5_9FUNG|nr:Protein PNS1 [Smittium culicis]